MKTIILYYSFEGSTEALAKGLAKGLDADLLKIEPVKELKSKGFSKFFWGGSQVMMKKKPEIKPIKVDFSQYDLVIVGSPIWASTHTPPIRTLIEEGGIKGKKVAYFYTHLGGPGKAAAKFEEAISKDNSFVSSIGFVTKDFKLDKAVETALKWAKDLK